MGAPEGVLLKPEPLSYPFIDLASSKANLRRTERARGLRGYNGRLTELTRLPTSNEYRVDFGHP